MKATTNALLEEIANDFTQYLKAGKFRDLTSFSKKIDPNLNINEIDKLLRIHFVLTEKDKTNEVGVIDFIKQLSQRIRRIKTTVKHSTKLFKGEVRGRIDWKDTFCQRYNQNPKDKTLFVCDQRERNYDIPENLVLKRLLQIIHEIIYNDLKLALENEYEWLKAWVDEKKLVEILKSLFLRNVYLRRINLEDVNITDRMIDRALKSRLLLYKDAAVLLSRYRKLINYEFDSKEAKELLNNTFIRPEKAEVLFELYWIIKIIKNFKNARFRLIEPGNNIVAEWEDNGYIYRIYHNSTGSFRFIETLKEINKKIKEKNNYLGRELKVLKKLEEMVGKESDSLWGGRPDIVLERYNQNNDLESIFIGEVKYTDDKNYAIQGLKELLEYIALIKSDKEKYIENYRNLFGKLKKVRGGLFVDEINDLCIKEDDEIKIIMFGKDKSDENIQEVLNMIR